MAISTTASSVDTKPLLPATSPAEPANPPSAASSNDKIADAQKANLLTESGARAQLNVSILQASLEVSINSQNDPLALVYKSAIENINDVLRPEMGDNAIQNAMAQDNSPEGTAGRIVSFVTNLFELYKQNNPDKDDATNIDNYMALIFKGVDQGFKEARGILDSLSVLNGDIASNIDKTYDLVQKSLADFIAKVKGEKQDGGDTDAGNGDGSGGTVVASQTTVSVSVSVTQTRISTTA
ncbi:MULTISPECIES: DUF5610 domain-containing protein [unclassified Herbaspirillum]|uniref:DUF5610 domain-containing protein n=1 Tax=unclassified Herbaspirillum TaxID=2624150 RepID=UPI001154D901|nr:MULTISPECIES: DUF5610 domain-containing protein [unclassified Herbaspirillum]MBB5390322.1 hypothetical protein [Herbaspirillum sp. SJZ102]TQK09181.1 hypothetical protein FB599_1542 [Herbaspirillum sp. SJZ130]TQK14132.1 hypothetical protein FB598_1500 [Herbaspirillum sp. SJZ106]